MKKPHRHAIMVLEMNPEFKWHDIKLAVGLGNPGTAYEDTFHNAGQRILRILARSADTEARQAAHGTFSRVPRKRFMFLRHDRRVFVIPDSFMNESGPAVKEALRYFKAIPRTLLLVHDDTDLPLGTFRFSFGSSAAGHKGVQSVIETLHTKDFWRLRIGTRKETSKSNTYRLKPRVKAEEFVLRHMTAKERAVLDAVAETILNSFTVPPTKQTIRG